MSFKRVDWDFQRLDSLIQARGENVIIETGVSCPCRNGDVYASLINRDGKPANQRRLNCSQCKGDGRVYRNARKIRGLVTSLNPVRDRSLIEMGYAQPGDVMFSPELNAGKVTDFDKITILYPMDVDDGQVIMRGAAHMEDNKIFVTDLETNEDRLWYEAVCSIWCEDINGVIYEQGADFEFENHKIRWVGNTPDEGTLYTVKYTAYLEWIVYSGGMTRIDNCRSLGQQVILKKKHVVLMTEDADNSVDTRTDEEIEFTTRSKL